MPIYADMIRQDGICRLVLFARISRVGRLTKQASCLHDSMLRETYDEQRE